MCRYLAVCWHNLLRPTAALFFFMGEGGQVFARVTPLLERLREELVWQCFDFRGVCRNRHAVVAGVVAQQQVPQQQSQLRGVQSCSIPRSWIYSYIHVCLLTQLGGVQSCSIHRSCLCSYIHVCLFTQLRGYNPAANTDCVYTATYMCAYKLTTIH